MASKLEQELLALAAKQGRQNQEAQPQQATPTLPPLEPGTLLSVTARGELEAARSIRAREAQAAQAMTDPVGVALPVKPTSEVPGHQVDVRMFHDPVAVPQAEIEASSDGISIASLATMFMNREAQAQADMLGIDAIEAPELPAPEMDIEFDSDFREGASPNEAVRFRVGRDDPPPSTFYRGPAVNTDGRVVSQMGDDGRFHAVNEGVRPMSHQEARTAPVSPVPTRPSATPSRAAGSPQQAPTAPEGRSHYPTVHEVIAGDDFLPDD